MRLFYSACGLGLSANRPIPGLVPLPRLARHDTRIQLETGSSRLNVAEPQETWYSSSTVERAQPALRVWRLAHGAGFHMRYGDGTEFVVDRAGSEIRAAWPRSSALEDTATYLLGPVLGFVLRLRGFTCLHASAVAVGDRAMVLAGPASAGKSTTAAALGRMGHAVLADDVATIVERDGALFVQPAYAQLRLWPESVSLLYGSADALPRLTPTWDKRALDLTRNGYRFEPQPQPLVAVYVLGERDARGTAPRVEPLGGRERLLALLANTYVSYLLDPAMRARELASLARLASRVPVRRFVPPADPSQVSRLCACLLEDCAALQAPKTLEP